MSKRVVFDIGHGSDTYPPSKGVGSFAEHSFNAAVAVAAKELAEYNGFEVLLPQQPNAKEVPLGTRSSWINTEHRKSPILCLLSFHANAENTGKASGHCVFYWGTSTNGKRLAQIWNRLAKESLPIPQFGQGIWASQRGDWTDFHILRETLPPAILMEHFFYTNSAELAKCNTPEFINLCAKVAVRAICEYAGVEYKRPIVHGPDTELQKKYDDLLKAYTDLEKKIQEIKKILA
jgi:N-acetylmuramoyl-L-alanine amidase